jgi:hypothetical protein
MIPIARALKKNKKKLLFLLLLFNFNYLNFENQNSHGFCEIEKYHLSMLIKLGLVLKNTNKNTTKELKHPHMMSV